MHDCSFESKNNVTVEFINIEDNKTIYKKSFNSMEHVRIKPRNGQYKNKLSYTVSTIYSV